MPVFRPLYEAFTELWNAAAGGPRSLDLRQQSAALDRAIIRVTYEMARSNGQEMMPFEEYLRTQTTHYTMHPEAAGEG